MVSKSKICLILASFVATVSLSCAPNIIKDVKPTSTSSNNGISTSISKFEYFVGNEVKGFVDGSVVEARFNNPTGMAVDERNRNLYVLDQDDKVIRKITPDGNVSIILTNKDIDSTKPEYGIGSLRIRDNFLYFIFSYSIKRINLDNKSQIENVVGSDEKGDVTGDFEIARFNGIESFALDNEDNLFILDNKKEGGWRIKKANLKTKKVETIKFESEGSTARSWGVPVINSNDPNRISEGNSSNLNINPKNNQLYFKSHSTFYDQILEINSKNKIMDIGSGFPGSFTFDNEGNMYVVSISVEKLLKISLDNKIEELSGFSGVLKIEKGDQFPEFGDWTGTNLAVDNNRKILYMSTSKKNKIFKLNLKGN